MFTPPIYARNVNDAFAQGLKHLDNAYLYTEEPSRNGPVRVSNGPVLTVTLAPLERVLFSPMRNANPFFHLFESLWMLAGRNDLPWLAQFNKRMAEYSDDGGKTQPAAYGHRWRVFFGHDQLEVIAEELRANPTTRRCVLGMWDPWFVHTLDDGQGPIHKFGDLQGAVQGSKDVPCNTHCYFRIRDGKLDMSVCCRSNDVLWGAHGANAVHFSIMQEYVAAKVGVEVGVMYQYSFNYHLYTDVIQNPPAALSHDARFFDLYQQGDKSVKITSLFTTENVSRFDDDLGLFMRFASPDAKATPATAAGIEHPFLAKTAMPMLRAWRAHKEAKYDVAWSHASAVEGEDWRTASMAWIHRRRQAVYRAQGERWTEWLEEQVR